MTGENNRAMRRVVVVANEFADNRKRVDGIERAEKAIKARLKEAGRVLQRDRPPKELRQLAGAVSGWPDIIHSRSEHGAWRDIKIRPVPPSAKEIDRTNEVLGWLLWLEPSERSVVFGSMFFSFRKLAAVDPERRSKDMLHRIFKQGISVILYRLVKKP